MFHNQAALDAWGEHGATPQTDPTMVHFLFGEDGFTAVVDAVFSPTGRFVSEVLLEIHVSRREDESGS